MSNTTLRFYNSTLSYSANLRDRKLRGMKKRFKTRISRRRVKQVVNTMLYKLQMS